MLIVFALSWNSKLRRSFDIETVAQDVRQTVGRLAEIACVLNCLVHMQSYSVRVVVIQE